MQHKEKEARPIRGAVNHRASVMVPPFEDVVVHWQLATQYSLRGGVLSDEIGFGKTTCTIALIAQCKADVDGPFSKAYWQEVKKFRTEDAPEAGLQACNASLVVVPAHLLFEWETQIRKFVGIDLIVITVASINDLPTLAAVKRADMVLVSINLFNSDKYHKKVLGVMLSELSKEKEGSGAKASTRPKKGPWAQGLPPPPPPSCTPLTQQQMQELRKQERRDARNAQYMAHLAHLLKVKESSKADAPPATTAAAKKRLATKQKLLEETTKLPLEM